MNTLRELEKAKEKYEASLNDLQSAIDIQVAAQKAQNSWNELKRAEADHADNLFKKKMEVLYGV